MNLRELERYRKWLPAIFFILGFVFDIFTLDRIDSPIAILQQGIYLLATAMLIGLEILWSWGAFQPGRLERVWKHREAAIQFMLGSLLSMYTLFFFKSASLASSLLFMLVISALLVTNEVRFSGRVGIVFRVALLSLSLSSFFICLVPMLFGRVGTIPFLFSLLLSGGVLVIYRALILKRAGSQNFRQRANREIAFPSLATLVLFAALYFFHLIPPVPVSVQYIGIYHDVQREGGAYRLTTTRPAWKFWQNGDQSFSARPGDRVFCFVRVFSPARFKDEIRIRWLFKDPTRGWKSADSIPLPITGGRAEGYRGYVQKAHYQPGKWRVQIETSDGREMARLHFTVTADESTEPREIRLETQ